MEIKDFKDYTVANISEEDVLTISQLEKSISNKTNNDIVLIAYQPQNKAKA
ncbi:MAG: hypothetical protein PHF63_09000 [Herbinix sp.]|nr:hypothetical protein [Herbinix sp.]